GAGSNAAKNGGPSGSDQSGQNTGKGFGNANDTENDLASFNNANQLLATINGTQVVDGPSTWDQVRGVQIGSGYYDGSAAFSTNGSSPQTSSQIHLFIDFGARSIGGSGSFLRVQGSLLGADQATINSTSFASLGGLAYIDSA